MIKLVYCLRKRSGLSDEEFHDYWRNAHGRIASALCAKENVIRYVQSHKIDTELNAGIRQSRGLTDAFDGIAELWWENLDAVRDDMANDALAADFEKLLADEAKFVDFSRSSAFFTDEVALYDSATKV